MKKINVFEKAFTLVELLIVIALIAILSVAVLATINPIEQSNKARDAKFKNDAAEVLSAYERYYTSLTSYPWMDVGTTLTSSIGDDIAIGSTAPGFGIADDGVNSGRLIASSELKSSFAGKEPFQADAREEDKMYLYHNGTTNDNYVCFHPKAAANRVLTGGTSDYLKCLVTTAGSEAFYDYGGNGGTCVLPTAWDETGLALGGTRANVICVPEGDVE